MGTMPGLGWEAGITMRTNHVAMLFVLLHVAACGGPPLDQEAYEAAVREWRNERVASLQGESGYLNLVGLHWLEPGEYTFGAAADNDIVFADTDTPRIGRFLLNAEGVRMIPEPGVDVRYEGIPVRTLILTDDTAENPVVVTHGSLAWGAIQRDGRYAIRVRNLSNSRLETFPGLEYFPIDLDYRVVGTLKPYEVHRVAEVGTVIEGLGYHPESPGVVEFELLGERHELEAYLSGERLFFVFGDRTNGRETYPAGRFLYALMPDATGRTVMDFNLSYSPPCAFNAFSTCPVAAPRNRLPLRIEAGELYSEAKYTSREALR
jgi:uncharacterized protein (DUF1684 family)